MKNAVWLGFAVWLSACAAPSSELTVVPGLPAKKNAERQADIRTDYKQPALTLKIGELNPVRNLDPLFASNEASQRIAGWVYEGLTGYNEKGELIPVLARRWTASTDSTRYTFYLRPGVYFHDDPFIGSGAGRLVTAQDVKKVFERMASDQVPPHAARMFAQVIRGFDAYFIEQQEVHDPAERRLTEIAGIVAESDSSVTFYLNAPDRHFPARLATPWAFIYPVEAVTALENGLRKHPVGTGPLRFVQAYGDSIWVFEPDPDHRLNSARPAGAASRYEVNVQVQEPALYKRFAAGELHLLTDLGPLTARTLITDRFEVADAFKGLYDVYQPEAQELLSLQVNPSNFQKLSRQEGLALVGLTPPDQVIPQLGPQMLSLAPGYKPGDPAALSRLRIEFPADGATGRKLNIGFPNDQYSRFLLRALASEWNKKVAVQLIQTAIVSRDIALYGHRQTVYLPGQVSPSENELFSVRTRRYLAVRKGVTGLRVNRWSWWMDVSAVVIPVPAEAAP